MNKPIRIAVWNANGLLNHTHELKAFIASKCIDIMLISETHFTNKSYMNFKNYSIYNTNHPAGTARGGTAIIVDNNIRHQIRQNYKEQYLQSTSIQIFDQKGPLTLAAVYCPPKYSIQKEQFEHFYGTLGSRFIAGGDYNAKHTLWGSRLITPKGRTLFKVIQRNNLSHISTGEPTYWPSDRNKLPDVIDFCITKGIPSDYASAESSLDLSSDHTPFLVMLGTDFELKRKPASLHNNKTNWSKFKHVVTESLSLNMPLQTSQQIDDAVENFNIIIQKATWNATPTLPMPKTGGKLETNVREKLKTKRHLRKLWQTTRDPADKKNLNRAIKDLKKILSDVNNSEINMYLSSLTATQATEYSLWKATKKLHNQTVHSPPLRTDDGNWACSDKEKAILFANHLSKVFEPFPRTISKNEESCITELVDDSVSERTLPNPIKISEVTNVISKLNIKKAPGYDLITAKLLKELPISAIRYITYIFNAVFRLQHFPLQWKVAQIILIQKPGKPSDQTTSYRPISLLPAISKVLETIILNKLLPIINDRQLIPDHQFGFRKQHSTIEQVNRVYKIARDALEEKQYCTAAFIDVSQAFDKVWHQGLMFKLKKFFQSSYLYYILKSYLENRYFMVKVNEHLTSLFPIQSGVPQGSVLGPVLYTLFTADLPMSDTTYTATFADDTVIMSKHLDSNIASQQLQFNLNQIQTWMRKWRIQPNEKKSVQMTFTLKRGSCPPVTLNGCVLAQSNEAKYLGIHLDCRLNWRSHIFMKRKQLGLKLRELYWLIDKKSKLSLDNKILVYKAILKPIWCYGIQLWGTAATSNIEILQRFQSKVLRIIANVPWYVTNNTIHKDLKVATVHEEIKRFSHNYSERLRCHTNILAHELINDTNSKRRLKRCKPIDLAERF